MEINLLYLYFDLLNLYGDNGNFRILGQNLSNAGFSVNSDGKTISKDVEIDFSLYDIIYIGAGTESNQKLAIHDLEKYKDQIKKYIESGKILIATGNSMEIFGKEIKFINQKKSTIPCLGIFDFVTTEDDKKRYSSDVIYKTDLINNSVIGYINKCSEIEGITTPLFSVEFGDGNSEKSSFEGLKYKNFYGTHLIGPLFVKNPEILKFIIKQISEIKNFVPMDIDDFLKNNYAAYFSCLEKLLKRKTQNNCE